MTNNNKKKKNLKVGTNAIIQANVRADNAFVSGKIKGNISVKGKLEITNTAIILGDIRDYDSVFNAIKKVNSVIHLAALIGIPYSYVSPLAYIKTNIEGTYNILEAAKNNNIIQTIITSTSEVYGTPQYVPIDEKHPLFESHCKSQGVRWLEKKFKIDLA